MGDDETTRAAPGNSGRHEARRSIPDELVTDIRPRAIRRDQQATVQALARFEACSDCGAIPLVAHYLGAGAQGDQRMILSGARVCYTMAKDGLFFRQSGQLNQYGVPQQALWVQCILTCFWCLTGKYGDLLDMVSFVVVLFYILTILGIFILRRRRPDADRPYKAFGYPVLPIIYILMGITFCMLLIIYKPRFTWPGLIIALIGIPIYYFVLSKRKEVV